MHAYSVGRVDGKWESVFRSVVRVCACMCARTSARIACVCVCVCACVRVRCACVRVCGWVGVSGGVRVVRIQFCVYVWLEREGGAHVSVCVHAHGRA